MTPNPETVFVIGASGTVGSDLTRCLLARCDMHIRAATRDAQGKKETDRLR